MLKQVEGQTAIAARAEQRLPRRRLIIRHSNNVWVHGDLWF